jgi:hypothetical protein
LGVPTRLSLDPNALRAKRQWVQAPPAFGGDAPVHDPDAPGLAVTLLNQLEHVPERGFVGGVAGEHFIGQRQSLGRDDQRHDDLHAIAALVPAVTETAGIAFIFGHVALKAG